MKKIVPTKSYILKQVQIQLWYIMESKMVGNGLDLNLLWLQKPVFILKSFFGSDPVHLLVSQY